ncbi:MAG TPA: Ig-like domain-containing protein [Polyangiaceae bacterium]|nr:Ig-like domain-containing protein [Polyangiaceae bacterium]
MNTKRHLGWGIGLGAVVALAFGGVAACSSDFSGDCRETHTCPEVDDNVGGDNAGGAPSDGNAGSQTGVGGGGAGEAGTGVVGGAAGSDAGQSAGAGAGAGGAPDCQLAANCFNPPPTVVTIAPADEATGIEPDAKIVITLSEPLDEATVNATNIRILDGGVPVLGQLTYADSIVTFTPDKPLALLAAYEVELTTAVADVEGAGLAEAFGSGFAVRDGSWSQATVVPGVIGAAPQELQLNSDGEALVSWLAKTQDSCAAMARWFGRGKAVGPAKPFTLKFDHFCADVHSAVSPNGLALLSWYEESDGQVAGQGPVVATAGFRDGQWGSASQRSSRFDNASAGALALDDGTMHYFGAGSDVQVWQTDTRGTWSTNGKALSAYTAKAGVQTATAKNGDAVAAWLDADASSRDRIVVARYSKQTATWSVGEVLPGSLSGAGEANRGVPAVAFDAQSQPLVVWQRGVELVSSHFDSANAKWANYVKVAGTLQSVFTEPPALVFDGTSFVAAYLSKDGVIDLVRYDASAGTWGTPAPMQSATTKAAPRMPRMTTDAHGNLLLIWASSVETGVYSLVYQRFDAAAGAWLGPKPIEGVTITNAYFDYYFGRFVMGGSANGLAAIAFADVTDSSRNLRLASFY